MTENPKHRYSSRALLIVVSIITILLLAGSAVLQRVVFHAATANASVYLLSTGDIEPGQSVDFRLYSDLGGTADVAGGQFVLSFDPTQLQFISLSADSAWRTVSQKLANGSKTQTLGWAVLPNGSQGATVALSGQSLFGSIRFQVLKAGASSISFDPKQTMIVGPSANVATVVNLVTSVQDTQVATGQQAAVSQPSVQKATSEPSILGIGERILNSEVVASPDLAMALVSLRYPGQITVKFGSNKGLTEKATSTTDGANAAIELAGLQPSTQYYYQVQAQAAGEKGVILSDLQSFLTPRLAVGSADQSQSIVRLFPNLAANTTAAYVFPRDATGNAIDQMPSLKLESGSANFSPSKIGVGAYVVALSSNVKLKQIVNLDVNLGNQIIANATATFDPNYKEDTVSEQGLGKSLALTPLLAAILVALGVTFILSLIGFIKLSSLK